LVLNVSDSNGYTLSPGTGGVLTLGTSSAGGSITVLGGTHSISASLVLTGSLAVSAASGASLDLSGSLSEALPGGSTLTLRGDGQLILSGIGRYTGGTTVEGGTLYMQTSAAIADGTSLTVGAGGTFIFDPTAAGSPANVRSGDSLVPASAGVVTVPEPGTLVLLMTWLIVGFGVWQGTKRIRSNFV